jgi:hypothetical protein
MRLKVFITLLAAAAPAFALVNFKGGYTSTMGELGERYAGGLGVVMELEVGLPGPIAIVPMGGYTQLGEDEQFTSLLNTYIEKYFKGIPIPPQLEDLGKINSSMYFFGAGLRFYAIKNLAVKVHAEAGAGYYYRDMDAQGVPFSLIAALVPELEEFEEAVEPAKGAGLHADFGLELFPISPVAPQVGVRYMHGFGVGRTRIDDYMAENIPGFKAPESKDVDMFLFYVGLGIF